jgi:hypothetical protein
MNTFQKFVEKHSNKPWEWGYGGFSSNPSITPEFVEKHSNKPWDWGCDGLSSNPSITPEFVEKHLNKPWDWDSWGLSSNPSITPEFVEKHLDKNWKWGIGGLSSNPSITPEFVEKNSDKPWEWGYSGLSSNPSITPKFVEKHSDKLCWEKYGLSRNPMNSKPKELLALDKLFEKESLSFEEYRELEVLNGKVMKMLNGVSDTWRESSYSSETKEYFSKSLELLERLSEKYESEDVKEYYEGLVE